MKRTTRTVTVLARLLPFLVAFLRDRRRYFLFGGPAQRSREQQHVGVETDHERRTRQAEDQIADRGSRVFVEGFVARAGNGVGESPERLGRGILGGIVEDQYLRVLQQRAGD